jgi:hypothetical protein
VAVNREEATCRLVLGLSESIRQIRGGSLDDESVQENPEEVIDNDDFDFECDEDSDHNSIQTDPSNIQGRHSSRQAPGMCN